MPRRTTALACVTLTVAGVFALVCPASAQVVQTVHSFTGCDPSGCDLVDDGSQPINALVRASDGNIYGTTGFHGSIGGGVGTIFRLLPGGTLEQVFNFAEHSAFGIYTDGCFPLVRLHESGSTLFGVTGSCGAFGDGTIFSLGLSGSYSKLHDFDVDQNPSNNGGPDGGIAVGLDGLIYGTVPGAGTNNMGYIYRLESNGSLTEVHAFDFTDGSGPSGDLMLASDGAIYGTTVGGGDAFGACSAYGCGTVFKLAADGTFSVLHHFSLPVPGQPLSIRDGASPVGGLVQGPDGALYGTARGGLGNLGVVFRLALDGTYSVLHEFTALDGHSPADGLLLASDGNFYGVLPEGGAFGKGTVYRITPTGAFTKLHDFAGPDGSRPFGGLAEGTDGNIYGTTYAGGANDLGVVFRLIPRAANLQISKLTAPAAVGPTATFGVSDTVMNVGIGPAGPSTTGVWLSTDASLDSADTLLGTRAVGTVAVGATNAGTTTVTLPGVPPGTYFVIVEADRDHGVPESSEGDNTRTWKLLVGPDYGVSLLALTPAAGSSSSPTTVTITTRNLGAATTTPSITRLYRSNDTTVGPGDVLLAEVPVAGLQYKQTQASTVVVSLPIGKYKLIAQADGAAQINELNEGNNLKTKSLTLGADLTVPALALTPAVPTSSVPTMIAVTTRNGGTEPAGAFVTRLYRSVDGVLGPGDTLVAEFGIAGLAPGASRVDSTTTTLPAGTYYLIAIADEPLAVAELLESNNLRKVKLTVP